MIFHKDLAKGHWFTFSLAEQLGNVGSEYFRMRSWKKKGNVEKINTAAARLFELLDLTLADSRWAGRRRELARLREEVAREFLDADYSANLQRYFDYFVLAARTKN